MKPDEEVPKWIVGLSASNMQIYYLLLNDYKNTSNSLNKIDEDKKLIIYNKAILHEFVHYVVRYFCKINNCKLSCKYLDEGIAQYLSN